MTPPAIHIKVDPALTDDDSDELVAHKMPGGDLFIEIYQGPGFGTQLVGWSASGVGMSGEVMGASDMLVRLGFKVISLLLLRESPVNPEYGTV